MTVLLQARTLPFRSPKVVDEPATPPMAARPFTRGIFREPRDAASVSGASLDLTSNHQTLALVKLMSLVNSVLDTEELAKFPTEVTQTQRELWRQGAVAEMSLTGEKSRFASTSLRPAELESMRRQLYALIQSDFFHGDTTQVRARVVDALMEDSTVAAVSHDPQVKSHIQKKIVKELQGLGDPGISAALHIAPGHTRRLISDRALDTLARHNGLAGAVSDRHVATELVRMAKDYAKLVRNQGAITAATGATATTATAVTAATAATAATPEPSGSEPVVQYRNKR